jgi:hypothetical protein
MKSFLSTRLTSIGFVIVLSIALFLSTKGNSQDARITQLRKGYQECVYDTVASQLKGNSQVINASAATELAFRACSTEEQAILICGWSIPNRRQSGHYELQIESEANGAQHHQSPAKICSATVLCSARHSSAPRWLRQQL